MLYEVEIILKILLSIALGSLVGVEREARGKPAGLKTHAIICLASTIFSIISINYFTKDYARMISNVLTGMGFIGAGAIIASGRKVVGITTATTLWITTAIGIAVGIGFYFLAIISTITVLIILLVFREVELEIFEKQKPKKQI